MQIIAITVGVALGIFIGWWPSRRYWTQINYMSLQTSKLESHLMDMNEKLAHANVQLVGQQMQTEPVVIQPPSEEELRKEFADMTGGVNG